MLARALIASLFAALTGLAHAGEHRFQILLDTDNAASTGCSLSTAKGTASGIDQVWTTVVTTTTSGASVTRIEHRTCVGSTLGPSTIFATAGWPAGLGNGTLGTAAIETYIPLSALPGTGTMKARVASTNATGGEDATTSFSIALGPSNPQFNGATPVPLSIWLVLPLGLFIFALVGWWWRWHPEHVSPFVCVVLVVASGLVWAATVTLDGNVSDWNSIAPVAGNPKGSAPVDANIVEVYFQSDGANLYFRIDADVRPDAGGNQAPTVSAGADQVVTLSAGASPSAVANLAGSASDDGLPNPPGALSLTWSKSSGPGSVAFGDASMATTPATFTVAGTYMLQLSAFDGALTSTSTMRVTVNASSGNLARLYRPALTRRLRCQPSPI